MNAHLMSISTFIHTCKPTNTYHKLGWVDVNKPGNAVNLFTQSLKLLVNYTTSNAIVSQVNTTLKMKNLSAHLQINYDVTWYN